MGCRRSCSQTAVKCPDNVRFPDILHQFHEWMRMQMLSYLQSSSRELEATTKGSCAQLGWRTFMMTCLRWILGYMRLEIWRKIGLSGDWCLCTVQHTRSGACCHWIGDWVVTMYVHHCFILQVPVAGHCNNSQLKKDQNQHTFRWSYSQEYAALFHSRWIMANFLQYRIHQCRVPQVPVAGRCSGFPSWVETTRRVNARETQAHWRRSPLTTEPAAHLHHPSPVCINNNCHVSREWFIAPPANKHVQISGR